MCSPEKPSCIKFVYFFRELWALLDAASKKPPNNYFVRYQLLNRKKGTVFSQFCIIKKTDGAERIRDVFRSNIKTAEPKKNFMNHQSSGSFESFADR